MSQYIKNITGKFFFIKEKNKNLGDCDQRCVFFYFKKYHWWWFYLLENKYFKIIKISARSF